MASCTFWEVAMTSQALIQVCSDRSRPLDAHCRLFPWSPVSRCPWGQVESPTRGASRMRRRSRSRRLAENHRHNFMDDLLRDPRLATSIGRYPLRTIMDFVVSHTFPILQLTRRPVQASTTCFAFDMLPLERGISHHITLRSRSKPLSYRPLSLYS